MKTILWAVLLLASTLACLAPTTNTPSVTLAWDATTQPAVDRYRVYWSTDPFNWTNSSTVIGRNNTLYTVTNLTRGTLWYFTATCLDTNGLESAYAPFVTYQTIPLPPAPLNLTITVNKP